jgi:SAM-dependent methyltransferase
MTTRREAILVGHRLPFYGRFSSFLANQAVVPRLVAGRWLDLLCGYDAALLAAHLGETKITEFHALDHRLSPELNALGLRLHECYIGTELPFEEQFFENVTMINGLEHLWHAQEVLNECFRVLRSGGLLQIVVPTWTGKFILEFIAFSLKQEQAMIEMNDHKMYYDEKDLWPMLVKAGFQPKHIRLKRIKLRFSLYAAAAK